MTDRELLEFAAKAAGYWNYEFNCYEGGISWNPLTDDGDVLRLAVKLDIPISPESANGTTWICKGDIQVFESYGNDPYAATRRAIVRAAAEIGKGLIPFPTADEIRENWLGGNHETA